MAKTKQPEVDDATLAETVEAAKRELAEFEVAHRSVAEDAVEHAEQWLALVRGADGAQLHPASFAGGYRSLHRAELTEVVCAFVVSSGNFREWLLSEVAKVGGSAPGISALSRKERDARLAELKERVRTLEAEAQRRVFERARDDANAALAELG